MRVSRRPSIVATAALSIASLAAAGPVAASTPDDGIDVTPEALVAAAELSAETPSRYEMYIEMTGAPGMPALGSADTPLATGAVSGTSATASMDLSVLAGGMLPVDEDLLTMEVITIGQELYLRAPFFSALAEMSGGAAGPIADLAELGDAWAYVDGGSLAADAGDVGSVFGANAGDPAAIYAAIGTTSKTAPIGTETIHGVPSSGVRAMVDIAAVIEAQNLDPSAVPAELADLDGLELPVEVWLGDNGYITRVVIEMDVAALAAAAEQSATPAGVDLDELGGLDGLVTTMTMESFDFGAADIVIEAPAEFVDVTELFAGLLAQAQQGT